MKLYLYDEQNQTNVDVCTWILYNWNQNIQFQPVFQPTYAGLVVYAIVSPNPENSLEFDCQKSSKTWF